MAAKKKKPGIDYTAAPTAVAAQVFGVSQTTLDKWRKRGCDAAELRGRSLAWNIPRAIEWKIEQASERVKPSALTTVSELEDPDQSESDVDLAMRTLRQTAMTESGVARVNAAKALLEASRKTERPETPDCVIAFTEIANINGIVSAVGKTHIECPDCGADICVGDAD